MSKRPNLAVCLICGDILHSKHVHDCVTCTCPNQAMVDGGNDYFKRGAMDMMKLRDCLTMAEAKRLSAAIKEKRAAPTLEEAAFIIRTLIQQYDTSDKWERYIPQPIRDAALEFARKVDG